MEAGPKCNWESAACPCMVIIQCLHVRLGLFSSQCTLHALHKRISLRFVHHLYIYDTTCTACCRTGTAPYSCDLDIYSKAQQILWRKPHRSQWDWEVCISRWLALRASKKLYGDGELLDILTESDVYAEGTDGKRRREHTVSLWGPVQALLESVGYFHMNKEWIYQIPVEWV